jgi:hypothetical protein
VQHILGELEHEIRIQTLGGSFTPFPMSHAAGIPSRLLLPLGNRFYFFRQEAFSFWVGYKAGFTTPPGYPAAPILAL